MLIESFAAPMFGTNCWIIAPGPGSECVVVDPGGPDVSADVMEIVNRHGLKPVAVLLTHGHLDHIFSVVPVADGYNIPAMIHSEDRILLTKPQLALSAELGSQISHMRFVEPEQVQELRNHEKFSILDLDFEAIHAPGHTRGSLMYSINGEVLVSGDVLFAGSIGRTDLPTGSHQSMIETLTKKVLPLPDNMRVLTGHGEETTIGFERKNNPYLKELLRG